MGNVPLTWGAITNLSCTARLLGFACQLKSESQECVKKTLCLVLPCSMSNHMKVSMFYFEKEEKTPNLQGFCMCVCCFSSLVLVLVAGVKNRCCVNLKMRHQGLWLTLWLTKRISFLCIWWILKGYIKISWYVPRTAHACSWELLRLDDYQNYVSLEAKTKSQRVTLSQVTATVWVWHRFMPNHGALTVHVVRPALTLLFPEIHQESKGQKRGFASPVNLWSFQHFSDLEGLRRGRDFSEWKQYLGQPKHLIWIFAAFIRK